jgi:hypothetical protein
MPGNRRARCPNDTCWSPTCARLSLSSRGSSSDAWPSLLPPDDGGSCSSARRLSRLAAATACGPTNSAALRQSGKETERERERERERGVEVPCPGRRAHGDPIHHTNASPYAPPLARGRPPAAAPPPGSRRRSPCPRGRAPPAPRTSPARARGDPPPRRDLRTQQRPRQLERAAVAARASRAARWIDR